MSATSSAQSHGGGRGVYCRSWLLSSNQPDPEAGERSFVASIRAPRVAQSQSDRSRIKHLERPSRQDGGFATAKRRLTRNSWGKDSHAL
jgi:hypothetical protein